jgi:hypothetical protein
VLCFLGEGVGDTELACGELVLCFLGEGVGESIGRAKLCGTSSRRGEERPSNLDLVPAATCCSRRWNNNFLCHRHYHSTNPLPEAVSCNQ